MSPLPWSNNCWRLWRPERWWVCWGRRTQRFKSGTRVWYYGVVLRGNNCHDVAVDAVGSILGRLVGRESWQFLSRWDHRAVKPGLTQYGCCFTVSQNSSDDYLWVRQNEQMRNSICMCTEAVSDLQWRQEENWTSFLNPSSKEWSEVRMGWKWPVWRHNL